MSNELRNSKPAPHLISFDPSCFEQVGQEEVYYVTQSALKSGPAKFSDKTAAEEFAAKRNRTVRTEIVPVMKRTKWF